MTEYTQAQIDAAFRMRDYIKNCKDSSVGNIVKILIANSPMLIDTASRNIAIAETEDMIANLFYDSEVESKAIIEYANAQTGA